MGRIKTYKGTKKRKLNSQEPKAQNEKDQQQHGPGKPKEVNLSKQWTQKNQRESTHHKQSITQNQDNISETIIQH
jgi:hypothetical protein